MIAGVSQGPGEDARTNRRYHGHRQRDTQGVRYIRRYDMQPLEAAKVVAPAYDEVVGFAVETVLDWNVDISIFA